MRISDWSSDVCSSDLAEARRVGRGRASGVRRARANLSIEGRRDGGTQAMARRDRGVVVAPARELQGACRGRPVSGAAVIVALRVAATPEAAFAVFTRDIGTWWRDRKSTRLNSSH